MRVSPSRPRRGPKPAPPVRLSAEFVRAVRSAGPSMTVLSTVSGFTKLPRLSALLYSACFSATPLRVQRLKKLAEVVQFPPEQIFEGVGR